MYALRTWPTLVSSVCYRHPRLLHSIVKPSNQLRTIADRVGVKHRSRRYFRNYLIFNGILFGGSGLYYYFYLNAKERRQIRVTFEGLQRAFRSFRIGLMITIDYKYHFWKIPESSLEYDSMLKECHKRAAARIAQGCIDNGGLYVKMGQGIVTADHIMPKEYCDGLRLLQDQALRRQRNEVDLLIDEEFGCQVSDIFSFLSPEPIAAASLAEVYEGRLKSTNERVAVKMQYIDLQDRFTGDILTIRMILYALGKVFPKFEFGWMIGSIRENLERELNFKLEGENAERCYAELSPHLKFIYVPKVHWEYTTKRVLVMEYIDGIKISNVEEIKRQKFSLKEIDRKLVEAMAFQIFHSGFVHADPHPGNVYVRRDPKTPHKTNAQIVLLDHGLYETIKPQDREALCQLWKAIVLKDEVKMKHYSLALGVQAHDYLTFATVLSMRPIHRPIHELAILPEIWDRMSADEKKTARNEGKIRLPTEKEFLTMGPERKLAMRKRFSVIFNDIQDSVLRILHDMPRPMLMILRNLNQIRSTIRDHGNLIDRHTIMARSAILGARKYEKPQRFFKDRIYARLELFLFDLILFKDRMERWFKYKGLKILLYFGYVSKETADMIEQFQ